MQLRSCALLIFKGRANVFYSLLSFDCLDRIGQPRKKLFIYTLYCVVPPLVIISCIILNHVTLEKWRIQMFSNVEMFVEWLYLSSTYLKYILLLLLPTVYKLLYLKNLKNLIIHNFLYKYVF